MTTSLATVGSDVAEAAASVDERGYAVVLGALTDDEVAGLRDALVRQAAIERDNGIAARDNRVDDGQRVFNLVQKSARFLDLAQHPIALGVMEALLGPAFLLSNLSANITRPGRPEVDSARNIHHDVGFIDKAAARPQPLPPYPIVGQIVWMLDDFTEENGATRIVPGSHRSGRWPTPADAERSIAAVAPRGSALIFDGRLWHQTGTNIAGERHAVLAYYCAPWVRQQENWAATLPPGFEEMLDDNSRRLLGFDPYVTLGTRRPYPVELATADRP